MNSNFLESTVLCLASESGTLDFEDFLTAP